jgi:hypothetical protein
VSVLDPEGLPSAGLVLWSVLFATRRRRRF